METLTKKNHTTNTKPLQPGKVYVKKRCGDIAEFNEEKILTAIKKAFIANDPNRAQHSEQLQHQLQHYTQHVLQMVESRRNDSQIIEIEQIQDYVEITLMREGEHQVARSYVLYRAQRNEERKQQQENTDIQENTAYYVHIDNNQSIELTLEWITTIVKQACSQCNNVDPLPIVHEAKRNLFDGISIENVFKAIILSSRTLIETNPNYSYVTANLLLQSLFKEVIHGLKLNIPIQSTYNPTVYQSAFNASAH